MCRLHYGRMQRTGDVAENKPKPVQRIINSEMQIEYYDSKPYAIIELTRGYKALIDIKDFPRISKVLWHANVQPYQVRAARIVNRKMVYMQHAILETTPWEIAAKGLEIDHRDGFTLHNWRDNLRITTHTENMRNTDRHRNRVGVSFHQFSGLYFAYLSYPNAVRVLLGYWRTEEKAIEIEKMARVLQEQFLDPREFKKHWKTVRPREPRESEKM